MSEYLRVKIRGLGRDTLRKSYSTGAWCCQSFSHPSLCSTSFNPTLRSPPSCQTDSTIAVASKSYVGTDTLSNAPGSSSRGVCSLRPEGLISSTLISSANESRCGVFPFASFHSHTFLSQPYVICISLHPSFVT